MVDAAFPTYPLLKALKRFEPQSQGTQIELKETVLGGAEEALLKGMPDLVISPFIPKGYLADSIIEVGFIAVAAPTHALFNDVELISNERLANELQIVIRDSSSDHKKDAGWLGSDRRWTVSSIQSALEIVSSGIGFAWLPTSEIAKQLDNGGLKAIPLVSGSYKSVHLYAIFGKGERTGPATQLFLDILQHESSPCPSSKEIEHQLKLAARHAK